MEDLEVKVEKLEAKCVLRFSLSQSMRQSEMDITISIEFEFGYC